MSFSAEYFYLDRGSFNSSINQDTFAIHRYFTGDLQEMVEATGYFPPYFGFDQSTVHLNDHLYVQFFDGSYFEYLVSIDGSGNISLQLITNNGSSESIRVDTDVSGVSSFYEIFTFYTLTRQSNLVCLHIPAIEIVATQVDRVLSFSEYIPSRFLPLNNFDFTFYTFVLNQNLWVDGVLNILPSGSIQIGVFNSYSLYPQVFSVGNIGWGTINVSWPRIIN